MQRSNIYLKVDQGADIRHVFMWVDWVYYWAVFSTKIK